MEDHASAAQPPISFYTYPVSPADRDSRGRFIFRTEGHITTFFNVSLKRTNNKNLIFIGDALQAYKAALKINPRLRETTKIIHLHPFNRKIYLHIRNSVEEAKLYYSVPSHSNNLRKEKITGKRLVNRHKKKILDLVKGTLSISEISGKSFLDEQSPEKTPFKSLPIVSPQFDDTQFIQIPSLTGFSLQELADNTIFEKMHGAYKDNRQTRRKNAYKPVAQKKINLAEEVSKSAAPPPKLHSGDISGRFIIALRDALKEKLTLGIRLQRFFNLALTRNAKAYEKLKDQYEALHIDWYIERMTPISVAQPTYKKPKRTSCIDRPEETAPVVTAYDAHLETIKILPKAQRIRYLSFWEKAYKYKQIEKYLNSLQPEEKKAKFEEFERLAHNFSLRAAAQAA